MTGESENVTMEPPHIYVERTLAIIKPDAIHKAEEIEDIILRSGFSVLQVIFFKNASQLVHTTTDNTAIS